jgi:small subunit ribosomal protein S20
MPLIKSAKKKLRQDKKRTKRNKSTKDFFKEVLKNARKDPTTESLRLAVKITDKSVKKNLIHKNKAARIKSALSKLLSAEPKAEPVKVKKAPTKAKKKAKK